MVSLNHVTVGFSKGQYRYVLNAIVWDMDSYR